MKLQSFCKAVELKVFGEKKKLVNSNTSHSASVKDQSFITGGGGGVGWYKLRGCHIFLCTQKLMGHEILQPFLGGHVFLRIEKSFLQIETILKESTTSQILFPMEILLLLLIITITIS